MNAYNAYNTYSGKRNVTAARKRTAPILLRLLRAIVLTVGERITLRGLRVTATLVSFFAALGFIGGISLEFYCVQEFLGGRTVNTLAGRVPDIAVNIAVLAVVTASGWALHWANNALWRGLERIGRKNVKS